MKRLLLTLLALLTLAAPVEAQNFMRAVPPSLVYNDGACATVTGGGVGPLAGGFCWRTDNQQLYWWNLTAWQSLVFGASPTLTSPTVTSGLTVSGGAVITGGLTLDSLALTGLAANALVLTNALGVFTTTTSGTVTAPPFQSLTMVAGSFQLPGDLTLPVERGGIVSPGFGAVTIRVRSVGPGKCGLTTIGGANLTETQLGAAFPC